MYTGKTSGGFEFEIPEENIDDMELIDALVDVDNGQQDQISTVCLHLLGKAQRARLYEHLRGENGRVRATEVSAAILEILGAVRDGKKS